MLSDYWEQSGQVFCHMGKRYGLKEFPVGGGDSIIKSVILPPLETPTNDTDNSQKGGQCHETTCQGGIRRGEKKAVVVTANEKAKIKELFAAGKSMRSIAREMKYPNHLVVSRVINRPVQGVMVC